MAEVFAARDSSLASSPAGLSTPEGSLVRPFPEPSRLIRASIAELQVASESIIDDEQAAKLARLPKPWEPASCDVDARADVWQWLEKVADWINTQHLWAIDRPGVPECWPRHPHLAHDLAVVASSRYVTTFAFSPTALENWHRIVLPAFLDRLTERMGGGCLTGGHAETPRAARDLDYRAKVATARRRTDYVEDLRS